MKREMQRRKKIDEENKKKKLNQKKKHELGKGEVIQERKNTLDEKMYRNKREKRKLKRRGGREAWE